MVKDRNEKLVDVLLSRADVELILEALENYVPRSHTAHFDGMELISFMERHKRSLQRDNLGV
tara:strand:- start:273 stop:458 length:186 start_codon:yes stop_codon:yes gene_type:complete